MKQDRKETNLENNRKPNYLENPEFCVQFKGIILQKVEKELTKAITIIIVASFMNWMFLPAASPGIRMGSCPFVF